MNTTLRCLLWLCCCAPFACDGFGRAIVGQIQKNIPPIKCGTPPPTCDQVPLLGTLMPPAAPSFTVLSCGDSGLDCSLGEAGSQAGFPLDPTARQNCDLTGPLSDVIGSSLRTLSCTRASLTVPPSTSALTLDQLVVQNTELTLVATSAVTIELSQARLESVRLALQGPITLRITQDSQLTTVQIAASDAAASLVLSESKALTSSFVGFAGMVSFDRVTLKDADVFAGNVQLQNVSVLRTNIATLELTAVELTGSDLTLELESGSMAGATLQHLIVQKCGSLFLEGSSLYHSTFGACREKLVVDRGTIGNSTLFGPIESNVVDWVSNLFASGTPASLVSWNDSVSNNRFCDDTGKVEIGLYTDISCNICDEVRGDPAELFCTVPDPDPNSVDNAMGEVAYAPRTATLASANPDCPALELPTSCEPLPVNSNPF